MSREESADGKSSYRERDVAEINFALSQAYGARIDFSSRLPLLRKIADYLNCGNFSSARIGALHLRLPEIHDQDSLARLNKAEAVLAPRLYPITRLSAASSKCSCPPRLPERVQRQKRDVSNEPRIPKGQTGGGQWTIDSGTASSDPMLIPAQAITIPFPGSGSIITPRPIPILPPIPIIPTLPNDGTLTPTNPYPKDEECAEEWEYAMKKCDELLDAGKFKPGRSGYGANYNKCLMGLVSERCGGNLVA